MDPEDADQASEARPPLLEDLVSLCRDLNREQARYVVIGGMAVIQAGFGRATNDIDPDWREHLEVIEASTLMTFDRALAAAFGRKG